MDIGPIDLTDKLFYAPQYCRYCGISIVGVNWGHVASEILLHCPSCRKLLKKTDSSMGWIA
jgi:hypothetical protein